MDSKANMFKNYDFVYIDSAKVTGEIYSQTHMI